MKIEKNNPYPYTTLNQYFIFFWKKFLYFLEKNGKNWSLLDAKGDDRNPR